MQIEPSEVRLRPCPFCGGKAVLKNYIIEAAIYCDDCPAKMMAGHNATEDTGIAEVTWRWNKRVLYPDFATRTTDAVVERVARAIARATATAADPSLSETTLDALVENMAVKFYPEARAAVAALRNSTDGETK
jgi:hypothetical protein